MTKEVRFKPTFKCFDTGMNFTPHFVWTADEGTLTKLSIRIKDLKRLLDTAIVTQKY